MISAISCFSSSQPATSVNRTLLLVSSWARDLPNSKARALAEPEPFIRLTIQMPISMIMTNGIIENSVSMNTLDASASTMVSLLSSSSFRMALISSSLEGTVAVKVTVSSPCSYTPRTVLMFEPMESTDSLIVSFCSTS